MKEVKLYAGTDGRPVFVSGAFGNTGPWCAGVIENILDLGGQEMIVRYYGCNYLFKGVLERSHLEAVYAGKRLLSNAPSLLGSKWIVLWLGLFGTFTHLLPKKMKEKSFILISNYLVDVAYMPLQSYILQSTAYNKPIRELYKAINSFIQNHFKNPVVIEIMVKIRDIISMTMQFDIAYRPRYQDILPLINKESLNKNPRKELMRVLKIYLDREISLGVKNKWNNLWRIANPVLWFVFIKKKRRKAVLEFFDYLDLNNVKMDESDWYFCLDRDDFNFGGLSHKERIKIMDEMDKRALNHRLIVEHVQGPEEKINFYDKGEKSIYELNDIALNKKYLVL